MAPQSFSHRIPSFTTEKTVSKHRETDRVCEVRLEADGATHPLSPHRDLATHMINGVPFLVAPAIANPKLSAETPCRFINGWFCKQCDRTTEHNQIRNYQVCIECGSILGTSRSINDLLKKEQELANKKRRVIFCKQRIRSLEAKLKILRVNPRKCNVELWERRLSEAKTKLYLTRCPSGTEAKRRHLNVESYTPKQSAEFAKSILEQFREMGE